MKLHNSGLCDHCGESETVGHYLIKWTRNGVDRNIKAAYVKLQLDIRIKSLLPCVWHSRTPFKINATINIIQKILVYNFLDIGSQILGVRQLSKQGRAGAGGGCRSAGA
jgi:hypothetical protein